MEKPTTQEPRSIRHLDQASLGTQVRALDFTVRNIVDEEERLVDVAFSSTEPVERWYGLEVLSHDPGAADLARMNNGAPLLWMHNPRDMRGKVIEGSAAIDSGSGVGRCTIKISRNPAGEELWTDIRDGIVQKISFGYLPLRAQLAEVDEESGLETWLVTKWRALEVSCVSIPADDTVGIGRSAGEEGDPEPTSLEVPEHFRAGEPQHQDPEPVMTEENTQELERAQVRIAELEAAGNDAAAAAERRKAQRLEIRELGKTHNATELAAEYLAEGRSLEEFKSALLKRQGTPVPTGAAMLGLDEKEKKRWSFFKLIRALAQPGSREAANEAAFELETSAEMAEQLQRDPDGAFVPPDVMVADTPTYARVFGMGQASEQIFERARLHAMQRDLTVGGSAGNLKGTDLLGASFIEVLRNAGRALPMATVLTDLVGDIAIPRHTTETTAYWIAESAAPTEGAPVFDQVTMQPKTVGAWLDLSRKLLKQSSIDIQAWTFAELAAVLGLAVDAALINGSGAGANPTGILNTSGIGDVAGGTNGAAPTWDDIVNIKKEVAKDNALLGDPVWLLNSDSIAKLERVDKASGAAQFVLDADAPRQTMGGFPWVETNAVPNNLTKGTGSNLSALLFGNFRDALVGMWGGLDIVVDTASLSTQGGLRVTAFQDADIAVRHAQSFSAMQDAITT